VRVISAFYHNLYSHCSVSQCSLNSRVTKIFVFQVVILQKYWRRWLARRFVTKLKDDMQARVDWEKREEIKKREEKELRMKKEYERRMNPKSKEDFDLLYAALESKCTYFLTGGIK